MKTRWTCEQANEWYAKLGWLRGCNFIGSDCANRIDMWQSYGSEARLENADRELALCEKIGFNTVRYLVEFDVWYQERESFMDILEQYIALAAKHGQLVMLCLANEAQLPRGDKFVPKPLGEQFYALGYHQGRLPLTAEQKALAPYHVLERPDLKPLYIEMVQEIVGKYAHDKRVLSWNVYNEPGVSGIGDRAIPMLHALFDAVREMDPDQPLCADIWRSLLDGKPRTAPEKVALELSDIISYHSYTPYENMVPQLEALKELGRPIFITEWLNRINHSDVRELYPLFYLENISCYCWGFVVGKTQTNEPWEALWADYYNPEKNVNYDFTKWQHDLFRPNLRPYDPNELEIIKRYNKMADARFEKQQNK